MKYGGIMSFSKIIGQRHVVDSLISSVNKGTAAHAYIFEGPDGIGKKTAAQIFAEVLVCEEGKGEACGKCKSCLLTQAENHPDIKVISSETSIGVEEIRNLVKDAGVRPYYEGKKVYIIEDAENMTVQAQNSLLKTLEEPPEYVTIILTVENSTLLLPTIISRCIVQKFVRNTTDEIEKYIVENYPQNKDKAKFFASLSDGVIGNAQKLLGSGEFNTLREETFKMVKKLLGGNRLEALESSKFFIDRKDNIDLVLHLMLLWFRDILIMRETNNNELIVNSDLSNEITGLSRANNTDKISKSIEAVLEAKSNISANANFQMTIEVMLLKING